MKSIKSLKIYLPTEEFQVIQINKKVGFTSPSKSPFSFFPIYLSLFAPIGTISDTDKKAEKVREKEQKS